MARIPVGNFGFKVAEPARGGGMPTAAFVTGAGEGLEYLGGVVANYAEDMFNAEAVSQATKAVIEGKQKLQDWHNDLESNPVSMAGTNDNGEAIMSPRYGRALTDYDSFSKQLVDGLRKGASNRKAQQIIQESLGKYSQETVRFKVAETVQKQQRQWLNLEGQSALDTAVRYRNVGAVDMAIKSMLATGALAPDKAMDTRQDAVSRIEYANHYEAIFGATSKERLFEVRGRLTQFNPNMSPEANARLMAQVNERIDRFDQEAEAALKQSQDGAMRELTDLSILGQLNKDILLNNSERLSKTDRNILAGLVRQQEKEGGRDDLDVVRKLQIGVLTGSVDEKQLTRVASGYNPLTGEIGDAPISPQTYRQLMSDIRTMKDENFQQGKRPFQTADYEAAKEYLRLQVPDKKTGSGLFDAFMLSSDDSEKLSMALSSLYQRAKEGKADHLKWAQDFLPQIKSMKPPAPTPKVIPKTPSSGPITDKKTGKPAATGTPPAGNVWKVDPSVQKARDNARVSILRTELAAERANLKTAKTIEERRRITRNIEMIGKELKAMGVAP